MPQILHRTGTLAQLAAASLEGREPWYASDYGREGIGPVGNLRSPRVSYSYAGPSFSSALTDGPVLLPGFTDHYIVCDCQAGSGGTFTAQLAVPIFTARADGVAGNILLLPGDMAYIQVSMPTSANPTLQILGINDGGGLSLLTTVKASDGVNAAMWMVELKFLEDGSGWDFWTQYKIN